VKILFCIDQYKPSRGGAESYLRDLARGLSSLGHFITVAALEAEPDGVSKFLCIPTPSFPRLLREITFARRIARLKRQGEYDRVVGFRHLVGVDLFQPHEGLFSESIEGSLRPVSARSAFLARCLFLRKLLSPKNLFFIYADRALFRRSRGLKVAALSEMTATTIRKKYARYEPRIEVIPNGVDRARFHPGLRAAHRAEVRAELGIREEERFILFAAHNFRLKGLKEAVMGVSRYRNLGGHPRLVVVGRGRDGAFRSQCLRLGLEDKVLFLGPRADMERLYGAADTLLHPTYYDPCSLVVLEALGAGVPVVTTRFNGAAELMAGGKGGRVLDHPSDHDGLARALDEILEPGRFDCFREEAAELGGAHDFTRHLARMERWIVDP
jgi:UDP-glucose:(heptosyl)LPS alpha-1,3-glucosyltransferase